MDEYVSPEFRFNITVNGTRSNDLACVAYSEFASGVVKRVPFDVQKDDFETIRKIVTSIKNKQDIQMEIDIVDKSNSFFERDKPLGIVKTILSVQFVDKVMVNFTINTEQTSECFYVPDFLLVDKLEEICQKLNELL